MIHYIPSEQRHQHLASDDDKCSSVIEAIFDVCHKQGLKLTNSRRSLIQHLARADRPMKAYDLAVAISEGRSTTYPPVVYRILEVLRGQGCAHKLTSINSYVLLDPRAPAPSAYLVCEKCETVEVTSGAGIPKSLVSTAEQKGFAPRSTSLEVIGLCRGCRTSDRP